MQAANIWSTPSLAIYRQHMDEEERFFPPIIQQYFTQKQEDAIIEVCTAKSGEVLRCLYHAWLIRCPSFSYLFSPTENGQWRISTFWVTHDCNVSRLLVNTCNQTRSKYRLSYITTLSHRDSLLCGLYFSITIGWLLQFLARLSMPAR